MKEKAYVKKWLLILECVLVLGFLLHSAILLVLDKTMPPSEIARAGQEAYLVRYNWLKIGDRVITGFKLVYNIGLVVFAFVILKRKENVRIKQVLLYPVAQFVLMLIITGPFALLDRTFWGNYLYPVWAEAVIIAEITLMFLLIYTIRTRQER